MHLKTNGRTIQHAARLLAGIRTRDQLATRVIVADGAARIDACISSLRGHLQLVVTVPELSAASDGVSAVDLSAFCESIRYIDPTSDVEMSVLPNRDLQIEARRPSGGSGFDTRVRLRDVEYLRDPVRTEDDEIVADIEVNAGEFKRALANARKFSVDDIHAASVQSSIYLCAVDSTLIVESTDGISAMRSVIRLAEPSPSFVRVVGAEFLSRMTRILPGGKRGTVRVIIGDRPSRDDRSMQFVDVLFGSNRLSCQMVAGSVDQKRLRIDAILPDGHAGYGDGRWIVSRMDTVKACQSFRAIAIGNKARQIHPIRIQVDRDAFLLTGQSGDRYDVDWSYRVGMSSYDGSATVVSADVKLLAKSLRGLRGNTTVIATRSDSLGPIVCYDADDNGTFAMLMPVQTTRG